MYTNDLSDDQIKTFVSYWFLSAKPNKRDWYVQIDLHGGNNSAVSAVDIESTAYAHRDYLFMYSFYDRIDRGSYPADGFTCMQNFVTNVTVNMTQSQWGQYINYPDPKTAQNKAQARYWGRHLGQLQDIKAKIDPDNVFHFTQGILPILAKDQVSQDSTEMEGY
jgi:hypothetical protein